MLKHRFTGTLPEQVIGFVRCFAYCDCDRFAIGQFRCLIQLGLYQGVIVGLLRLSGAVFLLVAQLKRAFLVRRALRFLRQVYRDRHVSAVGVRHGVLYFGRELGRHMWVLVAWLVKKFDNLAICFVNRHV